MIARSMTLAAIVAALIALGAASEPTEAQDTGVSGEVQSAAELALEQARGGAVRATVTATVPGMRLSVVVSGRERELAVFAGPVSAAGRAVPAARRGATQTVTFGPQTP